MPYDSLGRQTDISKDDLSKSMLGPVGEKQAFSSGKSDDALYDKITDSLKDVKGAFAPVIASVEKLVNQVVDKLKDVRNSKGGAPSEGGSGRSLRDALSMRGMDSALTKQTKSFGSSFKMLDKLAEAGLKKHSIGTVDNHALPLTKKIANQGSVMIQLLVQLNKNMKILAKDTSPDPKYNIESRDTHGKIYTQELTSDEIVKADKEDQVTSKKANNYRFDRELFGKENLTTQWGHFMKQVNHDLVTTAHYKLRDASSGIMSQGEGKNPMQQGLFGSFGAQGLGPIFEGLSKSNEYQKNMAEIAYSTEGITGEMKKQQVAFMANQATTDIAISSGQEKLKIEENYTKLLRSGYKSQKDTLKITKIGAHLSTALGSNFEQTAEFANELHMALGLSADSVGEIARGMKQTARSSQISGDALIAAAKNVQPMLEAMKESGTLTADAANNMISMQASMQKFGVGSKFNDLMTATTSPTAAYDASFETQTQMAMMHPRGVNAFADGTMNEEGEMWKGMQYASKQIQMTFGKSLEDFDKMSNEELSKYIRANPGVDMAMKKMTGHGIGDERDLYRSAREGAKSFSERMEDVNKKLSSAATTEEERTKFLKQQDDLIQSQRVKIGGKTSTALGSSGSLSEAFAKIRNDKSAMSSFTQGAEGGLFGKDFKVDDLKTDAGMQAALKKTLEEAAIKNNAALDKSADKLDDKFKQKNVGSRFDSAIKSGDKAGVEKLLKEMEESTNAADAATMGDTDPARAAAKGINSLNAEFSKYSASALFWLKAIAGSNLIQGTGIASLLTGILSPLGLNKESLVKFGNAVGNLTETIGGDGKLGAMLKGFLPGANKVGPGGFPASMVSKGGTAAEVALNTGGFPASMGGKIVPKTVPGYGFPSSMTDALKPNAGPMKGITDTLKKGVFRFAEMQENMPVVGSFAKKFGAGKMIAQNTMRGVTGLDAAATASSGKLVAGVAAKAAIPLAIFLGLMESVGTAMETGAKASEIFADKVGKVGPKEIAAAENAGMLAGLINALTLGIFGLTPWFDSFINATAHFLDDFQALNTVMSAVMIPLKLVYGVVWGLISVIGSVLMGVWDAFVNLLKATAAPFVAVVDLLSDLWGVIKDVVSPLGMLFGEFKEGTNWVDALIGGFQAVGNAIRWILGTIGTLLGSPFWLLAGVIKLVAGVVVGLAKVIGFVLKPVIAAVSWVIGGVIDVFKGLFDVLVGIFTLDFGKISAGISSIFGIFGDRIKTLLSPLLMIVNVIGSVVGSIWNVVSSVFSSIGSIIGSIWNVVAGFFSNIGTGLMQGFGALWSEVVDGFWDGIGFILEPIKDVWNELFKVFLDAISPLKPIWDSVAEVFTGFGIILKDLWTSITSMFSGGGGDGISMIKILKVALQGVGQVIGFILRVVGALIGLVLKPLAFIVKHLIGMIGTVVKFFAKAMALFASGDLAGLLKHVFIDGIMGLVTFMPRMLIEAFKSLGTAIVSIFGNAAIWLGQKIKDAFASVAEWIGNLPVIKQARQAAGWVGNKIGAAAGWVGEKASGAWDWVKSKLGFFDTGGKIDQTGLAIVHAGEIIVPKSQANSITGAVGGEMPDLTGQGGFGGLSITDQYIAAASSLGASTNSIVAKPLTDVQTRVEQDMASSQPMVASVASGEMMTIASLTERQLTIMTSQLEVLNEIKDLMGAESSLSGISGAPIGNTSSNTKPANSPNYYNLSFGGFGNNASKGYINDGVT